MLSSRGSLTIDAVLNECVGRTATSHTSQVIPLAEAQHVWTTIGNLIHHQMLLGRAITIPKFCSFWCRQKHVATQGNVRFYVRELMFGFAPSFITTYNLDPMIPAEDPRLKYIKLPIDIISEEARVPADVIATIIREVALFIGEGTFRGKSFLVSFPRVVDVQLKKERAFVAPSIEVVTALFNIDSRKWPMDVRETAAAVVFRPRTSGSSSGSSRPTTARSMSSSRPATAGSAASTAASTAQLQHRPLFVTALPANKTFAEIEALPIREVRHKPRLPGAKGRAASANGGARNGPARATGGRHVDPLAPSALLSPSQRCAAKAVNDSAAAGGVYEEESVYDILSPSRREAAAVNDRYHSNTTDAYEEDHQHYDNAEGYGGYPTTHTQHHESVYQMTPSYANTHGDDEQWEALNPLPAKLPFQQHQQPAAVPSRNPLADRTAHTNNAVNTTAPTSGPQKQMKALFPWETALPLTTSGAATHGGAEDAGAGNNNAGGHLTGRRRFAESDSFTTNSTAEANAPVAVGALEANPAAAVRATPNFGRKRFAHPAEGNSVKGLLYDNFA